MIKIKKILPSLREKKRYITYEAIPKLNIKKEVSKKILELLGLLNYGKANVQIMNNIIRVNNKYVDHIKSALTLIKEVDNKPVIVKTVKVSGMINNVKKGGNLNAT